MMGRAIMMDVTQPRTKIGQHFRIALLIVLAVTVLLTLGRYWLLEHTIAQTKAQTFRLTQDLASELTRRQTIDEDLLELFLSKKSHVGYLVAAHYDSGYRKGYFRRDLLSKSAPDLYMFLRTYQEEKIISRILQKGSGYAGEYLHVVSAVLVPSLQAQDNTPLGMIKVGYVLPGVLLGSVPMGRGYSMLLMIWYLLAGLFVFTALLRRFAMGAKISNAARGSAAEALPLTEDPEVTWLEHETGKTEPIYLDEQGRSWRLLLPDGNMDQWQTQGVWYISGRDLIGRPWGSSAVRADLALDHEYLLQLRAMKLAGADGFIIVFPCFGYQLHWIIGGWGNRRSEVGGYPETSKSWQVEKQTWYFVDLRVGANEVVGFINNEKIWELGRHEITRPSPEAGFKGGLGVAVWSTLAKFTDIRFYQD